MIKIFKSAADAPDVIPRNSLICDKYEAAVAKIADGSVDAVIIDPPTRTAIATRCQTIKSKLASISPT